MHGISELERNPTDANSCLVRPVRYEDGLVGSDIQSGCSPNGELRGPGVVRNVEIREVGGQRRCVVELAPGLTPDKYSAYELVLRDRAVERSMPYRQLLIDYEALLEVVRLAEIKRDELKASFQARKEQVKKLTERAEQARAELSAKQKAMARMDEEYAQAKAAADEAADKLARLAAQKETRKADIKRMKEQTAELLRQMKNVNDAPAVTVPAAPAAPAANSYLFRLETMTRPNWMLDVRDGRVNRPAYMWEIDPPSNRQIWQWRGDSIVNQHSGMCLDVSNANTNNGARVIQHTCHGGNNQKWKPVGNTLRPFHAPTKCLDVVGGTKNGSRLVSHECHGGNNQNFREIRV